MCAPLANARGFDTNGVLFALRRQHFLELFSARQSRNDGPGSLAASMNMSTTNGGSGVSVMALVNALRNLEGVSPTKLAYNSVCYVLTLSSVNEHADYQNWTPHLGRQQAWLAIKPELSKIFPPTVSPKLGSVNEAPHGQLLKLLGQAAGAQALGRLASDPRLLSSLPSSLPFEPLQARGVHLQPPGNSIPGAAGGRNGPKSSLSSIVTAGASAASLSEAVQRLVNQSAPKVIPLPHAIPVPMHHRAGTSGADGNPSGALRHSIAGDALSRTFVGAAAGRGAAGGINPHNRASIALVGGMAAADLMSGDNAASGSSSNVYGSIDIGLPAADASVIANDNESSISATPLAAAADGGGGSESKLDEATLDDRLARSAAVLESSSVGHGLSHVELQAVRDVLRGSMRLPSPPRQTTPATAAAAAPPLQEGPAAAAPNLLPSRSDSFAVPVTTRPVLSSNKASPQRPSTAAAINSSINAVSVLDAGRPSTAAATLKEASPAAAVAAGQTTAATEARAASRGRKRSAVAWEVPVMGTPSAPIANDGEVFSESMGPYHRQRNGSNAAPSGSSGHQDSRSGSQRTSQAAEQQPQQQQQGGGQTALRRNSSRGSKWDVAAPPAHTRGSSSSSLPPPKQHVDDRRRTSSVTMSDIAQGTDTSIITPSYASIVAASSQHVGRPGALPVVIATVPPVQHQQQQQSSSPQDDRLHPRSPGPLKQLALDYASPSPVKQPLPRKSIPASQQQQQQSMAAWASPDKLMPRLGGASQQQPSDTSRSSGVGNTGARGAGVNGTGRPSLEDLANFDIQDLSGHDNADSDAGGHDSEQKDDADGGDLRHGDDAGGRADQYAVGANDGANGLRSPTLNRAGGGGRKVQNPSDRQLQQIASPYRRSSISHNDGTTFAAGLSSGPEPISSVIHLSGPPAPASFSASASSASSATAPSTANNVNASMRRSSVSAPGPAMPRRSMVGGAGSTNGSAHHDDNADASLRSSSLRVSTSAVPPPSTATPALALTSASIAMSNLRASALGSTASPSPTRRGTPVGAAASSSATSSGAAALAVAAAALAAAAAESVSGSERISALLSGTANAVRGSMRASQAAGHVGLGRSSVASHAGSSPLSSSMAGGAAAASFSPSRSSMRASALHSDATSEVAAGFPPSNVPSLPSSSAASVAAPAPVSRIQRASHPSSTAPAVPRPAAASVAHSLVANAITEGKEADLNLATNQSVNSTTASIGGAGAMGTAAITDQSLLDALSGGVATEAAHPTSAASASAPPKSTSLAVGTRTESQSAAESSSSSSSLPAWASHAITSAGGDASLAAAGYLQRGALPALAMEPVAIYRDSQPIRSVCFDPAGTGHGALLAIGTNSKALKIAHCSATSAAMLNKSMFSRFACSNVNSDSVVNRFEESLMGESSTGGGVVMDQESGLPELSIAKTWPGHHLGSVYCMSWAHLDYALSPSAGASSSSSAFPTDAVVATGSNDTMVKVTRFRKAAPDGSHGGSILSGSQATLALPTDAGTIRDVCWLGASSSHGFGTGATMPTHLAACGGGNFGIRVWEASTILPPAPPTSLAASSRGASGVQRAPSHPLMTLLGHTDTVHAVRTWQGGGGASGACLVSASEDGRCCLWDIRAGIKPVSTLCLSTSPGVLAHSAASLTTGGVKGGVELHSLSVRGREVAVGCGDGSIAIVDVAGGRMVCHERVHTGEVRSVDAMGPFVLSASFDGSVAMSAVCMDPTSLAGSQSGAGAGLVVLMSRRDHSDKTLCARWHPTSPVIATSSADKTAMLWSISGQ